MAAGSGAGAASVGIAGSAVVGASGNLLRGAAAIASCVAGPSPRISPENFKLWAEHLLRARGDNGICRDAVNSHYLEGDAVAMGYFGQNPMYERFAGPWRSSPLQMHDVDWEPPPEYRINSTIRDKLAPVDLRLYGDDVLFYTFYAFVSEALQILAANELYLRGWRYHIQRRVWLRQTSRSWAIFEPWSWQVVERDLDVDLTLLEGRPFPPKAYCARGAAPEPDAARGATAAGRARPGVPRAPFPQHCHRQGVPVATSRHHHCHRPRPGECAEEEGEQLAQQRRQLELQQQQQQQQQRWQQELQQRQLCAHHGYQQPQSLGLHFQQPQPQPAVHPADYQRHLHLQYHGNVVLGLPLHHGVALVDGAAEARTSAAGAALPPDCRVTI